MYFNYQASLEKLRISSGFYLLIIFFITLFIVPACEKEENLANENDPLNATGEEIAQLKSTGFDNAPSQSGAYVVRSEEEILFGFTLVDNKSNLVATLGYPTSIPSYCGGDAPLNVLTFQDILRANNGERIVEILKGQLEAKVYRGPLSTQDLSQWCPFFQNATLLAEGTVSVVSHTNEENDPNTNNQFVWGFQFHGKLLSPENKVEQFSAHVLFSWDKEDDFNTLLDLVQSVSVQLH